MTELKGKILDIREAGKYSGVSPRILWQLTKARVIPCYVISDGKIIGLGYSEDELRNCERYGWFRDLKKPLESKLA